MISFVSFPVFFGIAAVSSDLVPTLLGDNWLAVIVPLTLLPLVVPLRMLDTIIAIVLLGIGRPGRAASNNFIAFAIFAPAFAISAYSGDIVTVCVVWLLCYPVYLLITLVRTLPLLEISLATYLSQIFRPLEFSTIMFVSVISIPRLVSALSSNAALSLVAGVALGTVLYSISLLLFDKATLHRFFELIRS
jgi:O-antigen/teichoic acid export membrane protein